MPVSPPRPKDLPLTALRAFESAARFNGFAPAAQELGITPGAITAHVKQLEQTLGAPLFTRTPHGVRLTPLAQHALPTFTAAFTALDQAATSLSPTTPPRLTSLRAFEAAARLQGFAAAAQELGVTPGAVTAHIKQLEQTLGAPLFTRTPRGVRLTASGQQSLPHFTRAFDALGQAINDLRAAAAPRTVHIATLPAIAQLWLSPRLPSLRAAAPEITVSITALEQPPNLKRSPYDLSLFFSDNPQGRLTQDTIFPVCAPALAARLTTPQDIPNHPCLSDASWADDWQLWSQTLPDPPQIPQGPTFSLYALAVEECVNGAGLLIGHEALVANHLRDGRLIAPFPQRLTLARGLRLWSDRPLRPGTAARFVSDWLRRTPEEQPPLASPHPPATHR